MNPLPIAFDNALTVNKDLQSQLTPEDSLNILKAGNARFAKRATLQRDYNEQIATTSKGQFPFAAVVSCIDSRIPTEIVFDQGIGDIFNARVAGNIINDDILGSLEFACKLAGSNLIVVLGHTSCGAVKGACDNAELGKLTQMLAKIKPAIKKTTTSEGEARDSSNISFVNSVAEANVHHSISTILSDSEVLNEMHANGDIHIVGAMYDVSSGQVNFIE